MTKQKQKNDTEKTQLDGKVDIETQKLKGEADEFRNKYLRALADYQNLENRFRKDKEEIIRTTRINFLNDLLPFLDNLEKAEAFNKDPGLKMIKSHLQRTIADMGFEEIEVEGESFDPNTAEAIEIVPGEKDDMVVEVLRKGYRLNDRLVRPAQVKVSKKIGVSASQAKGSERNPKSETKS